MEMVVGNVDELICFGLMPGEDPGGLTEKVEKLVKEEPGAQFLVLVDIRGGSVSNSLSRLSVYDNVRIINGMNMALAIGLYLTDGILTDQEIEDLIREARNGLAMVNFRKKQVDEEDEII